LAALQVKPRRTIRIALWSGEEQGLLGSLAYVQQHFGSFENQKPEYAKLDAYFNIDSGTGKPRGAGVFGPPAAADMVREAMMPFADGDSWELRRATAGGRAGRTALLLTTPDYRELDWRRTRLIMDRLPITPIWTPTSAFTKKT